MMHGPGTTAAVGFTTLLHRQCVATAGRFRAPATSNVALAHGGGWPVESRREPGEGDVG